MGVKILKKNFFVKKFLNFTKLNLSRESDQAWYVNGVIEVKTNLYPIDILKKLFSIENHFKRVRKKKNEPRTIDLDLIAYNKLIFNKKSLILPHPKNARKNVCH